MTNQCIICGAEIPEGRQVCMNGHSWQKHSARAEIPAGRQVCTGCEIKSNADMEADLKAAHEEIGRLKARLEKFYISDTSKVKFFKDKNIKKWANSEYVWCERPCEHNMSMSAFDKQGELNGYASEYYWIFNDGCEEVKEITANEFMHEFVKPLIKENAELKARLDKLNGAIANMPKERLEEICKLYDLFINKKCYKYFAISNTENGKEIDEVIFKYIKIDGVRTCIIGYPENGCHGYWHTLKDMGIKYFVGENAKEQAEARLKELKGEK